MRILYGLNDVNGGSTMITAILLTVLVVMFVVVAMLARECAIESAKLKKLEAEHQRMAWKLTKLTGDDKPWRAE